MDGTPAAGEHPLDLATYSARLAEGWAHRPRASSGEGDFANTPEPSAGLKGCGAADPWAESGRVADGRPAGGSRTPSGLLAFSSMSWAPAGLASGRPQRRNRSGGRYGRHAGGRGTSQGGTVCCGGPQGRIRRVADGRYAGGGETSSGSAGGEADRREGSGRVADGRHAGGRETSSGSACGVADRREGSGSVADGRHAGGRGTSSGSACGVADRREGSGREADGRHAGGRETSSGSARGVADRREGSGWWLMVGTPAAGGHLRGKGKPRARQGSPPDWKSLRCVAGR